MTHSVVRIQTTNATLIFRSDSLGRRRQTERLLRTRNGSSRSLLRMQLCWEIIYNTSTAAVGKEERRRKRVSNAIDSGRRKMNARPSINRVSWVVYRSRRPRAANLRVHLRIVNSIDVPEVL